jgi:hypothetical protein
MMPKSQSLTLFGGKEDDTYVSTGLGKEGGGEEFGEKYTLTYRRYSPVDREVL